jgi:cell division protein FtsL
MNANILKMQSEIREMQAQNSALKQEVEKLQSPERMKGEAVRLGFNLGDEKKVSLVTPEKTKSSTSNSKNTKVASKP